MPFPGRHLRLPVSALAGATVTISLFLLMHALIMSAGERGAQRDRVSRIHFGRVTIPDESVARSRRKPPPPVLPGKPPPRPRMPLHGAQWPVEDVPHPNLPEPDLPLLAGSRMYGGNFQPVNPRSDGDVIPVVVIHPVYPRDAAISGTEGWVKVAFTITETGTVKDPRIVDAQPPRVFDREAIRAISRWKFKPRVVDGVPVERRATQVIDFSLDEAGR
jgi:protein TonB